MSQDKFIQSEQSVAKCLAYKKKEGYLEIQDLIAEEAPVAMVFNGISHAVMMATPQDLNDFALGFSIAENIINSLEDMYALEIHTTDNGIELAISISTETFNRLKESRRSLIGRTGCGLCGTESLNQFKKIQELLTPNTSRAIFSSDNIIKALSSFPENQMLQKQTGSTHASALCSNNGDILLTREDVGRHNALDKIIGASSKMEYADFGELFLITSSRASYEMVQKAAKLNICLLVAISAPTALAVRLADRLGITLIGFARNKNYNIYTHKERIR
ncbi:MAG: formate dehydrogenase accessory sulfurtransferase FdhD [Nitrosomonadales bacterium]|nr:formate dehydrogenase accessory sulfurtransferase FdhD [Nitrosomonadales bacterium]